MLGAAGFSRGAREELEIKTPTDAEIMAGYHGRRLNAYLGEDGMHRRLSKNRTCKRRHTTGELLAFRTRFVRTFRIR